MWQVQRLQWWHIDIICSLHSLYFLSVTDKETGHNLVLSLIARVHYYVKISINYYYHFYYYYMAKQH